MSLSRTRALNHRHGPSWYLARAREYYGIEDEDWPDAYEYGRKSVVLSVLLFTISEQTVATGREIAGEIGIPFNTINNRLHRRKNRREIWQTYRPEIDRFEKYWSTYVDACDAPREENGE